MTIRHSRDEAPASLSSTQAGIWILGGGRFGRRAAEILGKVKSPEKILVIDANPAALAGLETLGVQTALGDGPAFLLDNLKPPATPKWIIPCVPFHLAYKWVLARLTGRARPIPVPREYIKPAPHPLPAEGDGFFISHADFLCPPDCPEPADRCTHTGLPRKGSLFEEAAWWPAPGFTIEVIQSRQLAPGLGGILASDLLALEGRLSSPGKRLIVTACRCHGVVHALTVSG